MVLKIKYKKIKSINITDKSDRNGPVIRNTGIKIINIDANFTSLFVILINIFFHFKLDCRIYLKLYFGCHFKILFILFVLVTILNTSPKRLFENLNFIFL